MCVSVAVVVRLQKILQSCRVKPIHTRRNFVQNVCQGCTLAQLQFCNGCTYSFADTELAQTQAQTTETDRHARAHTHTHTHFYVMFTTPQTKRSCLCLCVLSLVLVSLVLVTSVSVSTLWTKLVQSTRYSFVPFHLSLTQQ
jgi:hypothetical protein